MSIPDLIILFGVITFVLCFIAFLVYNKLKGTPVNTCSYCASKQGNKLLKAYRKKYKK